MTWFIPPAPLCSSSAIVHDSQRAAHRSAGKVQRKRAVRNSSKIRLSEAHESALASDAWTSSWQTSSRRARSPSATAEGRSHRNWTDACTLARERASLGRALTSARQVSSVPSSWECGAFLRALPLADEPRSSGDAMDAMDDLRSENEETDLRSEETATDERSEEAAAAC
eukprot:483867-Prymnesium_polylepis.2